MRQPSAPVFSHNTSQRERELTSQAYSIECAIAEAFADRNTIRTIWLHYARLPNGTLRICYTIFDSRGLTGYYMLFQTVNSFSIEESIRFLTENMI